jgi:hypothetical protein
MADPLSVSGRVTAAAIDQPHSAITPTAFTSLPIRSMSAFIAVPNASGEFATT